MRIVDVTSFYSRNGGGIRTYLRGKSRALTARGHQVARIVPGEEKTVRTTDDGAVEHTLPGPPLPFDRNYRRFGDLRALGRLLHELGPEVIEVGSHYLLPWLIRRLAPHGPRVVGYLHSNVADTFVPPALGAPHRAAWRLVRAAHAHYDVTLCASRLVEARLRAHQVGPVVRVGLGVDLERFPARPSFAQRGQVCYVGRLARDKESALLLAAAPALARAGLRLRVAGDGPQAPRFAASRHLTYLGPCSTDEVRELLHTSDACLVPGRYETFSLAAAEALACGTPVVCAAGSAADELRAAAELGASFPAGDAEALAIAAARACDLNAERWRARAAATRQLWARELTWEAVATRLVAAYRGGVTEEGSL